MYSAHSPKGNVQMQAYADHVDGVSRLSARYADEAARYAALDGAALRQMAVQAAKYHDLGKLDEENQPYLTGEKIGRHLPLNHADAGAAYWLKPEHFTPYPAAVIQAHHQGFPDFNAEANKEERIFRDLKIAGEIDGKLAHYEAVHQSLVGAPPPIDLDAPSGDLTVFLRMLLSCIADADHTDTAAHYGNAPRDTAASRIPLRAGERLKRLDAKIREKQQTAAPTERNRLRNEMYLSCRNAGIDATICSCDSPVGSGKTTAVMANLLRQADEHNLRHIFVILPFTNIIRQSVETYRSMLTLPGEDPKEIVAELHHRADFESEEARHLTALWRAPIIVTTAVAFFETLASNSTATLRRLHELPGSAIFVDESHAAVPTYLLPLTWRWIQILSKEWSCYWTLASGSMCRFWTIPEIAGGDTPVSVPEIVAPKIRESLAKYEMHRILYRYDPVPKSAQELAKWITSFPGPRLVILNTVQSAAVLADRLAKTVGRDKVEHLSTALTPADREATLKCVKLRLDDKTDRDWTLVATSCVEAGMDFSFHIGFRELGALTSALQAAGRVNREGRDREAELWIFRINTVDHLLENPGLKHPASVVKNFLDRGLTISPKLTTEAMWEELRLYGEEKEQTRILEKEKLQNFPGVEHDYRVVNSDTRVAVVNGDVAQRIRFGKIDWRELQECSVQISIYKLEKLGLTPLIDQIYFWPLGYDDFLGYMAAIVNHNLFQGEAFII